MKVNEEGSLQGAKKKPSQKVQIWTNRWNWHQPLPEWKVWRRRGTAHDLKHTTSSVTHGVMDWSTGTQEQLNELWGVQRLSAQIQLNAVRLISWCFIIQTDHEPKRTAKAPQEFTNAKKWNILYWPGQSADLNPTEDFTCWRLNFAQKGPQTNRK